MMGWCNKLKITADHGGSVTGNSREEMTTGGCNGTTHKMIFGHNFVFLEVLLMSTHQEPPLALCFLTHEGKSTLDILLSSLVSTHGKELIWLGQWSSWILSLLKMINYCTGLVSNSVGFKRIRASDFFEDAGEEEWRWSTALAEA